VTPYIARATAPLLRKNAIMALEPPEQQHWQAAVGYVELGMFADADSELDKIDPFCRALPEVLAVRLAIYRGLKKTGVDAANSQTSQTV
jgi:hypothetical protein